MTRSVCSLSESLERVFKNRLGAGDWIDQQNQVTSLCARDCFSFEAVVGTNCAITKLESGFTLTRALEVLGQELEALLCLCWVRSDREQKRALLVTQVVTGEIGWAEERV